MKDSMTETVNLWITLIRAVLNIIAAVLVGAEYNAALGFLALIALTYLGDIANKMET